MANLRKVSHVRLNFGLTCFVMFQSIEIGLKGNLLCWDGELPVAEPPTMACAPRLALEAEIATEHEGLDPDAISPDIPARGMPCPNQIPKCLMQTVGNPDVGKFSRTHALANGSGTGILRWTAAAWPQAAIELDLVNEINQYRARSGK
jgi:hypothetical protein